MKCDGYVKCDGDHGEPKCADPSCWLGDPPQDSPRPFPLQLAYSAKQPELKLGAGKLIGWEEFDRWARHNSALWKCVSDVCEHSDLTEQDRLRLLCAALLGRSEELTQLHLKHMERCGLPITL